MQHIKAGPFSSFANRLAQLRDGHSGKRGERWDLLSSGTHTHTHTHTRAHTQTHLKVFTHSCTFLPVIIYGGAAMRKFIKVCEKMSRLHAVNTCNLWITACILIRRLSASDSHGCSVLFVFVVFFFPLRSLLKAPLDV